MYKGEGNLEDQNVNSIMDSRINNERSVCDMPSRTNGSRRQGVYWMLTVPGDWKRWEEQELPEEIAYIRGQQEIGEETSYLHWQLMLILRKKGSLATIKSIFGRQDFFAELTRSVAAEAYVWKEETRVEGTSFECGKRPFKRNSHKDWDEIWKSAKSS